MSNLEVWLKRAIDLFEADDITDGDLLTHDWIKYALDVKAPTSLGEVNDLQWELVQKMDSFKSYLLTEKKVALQSVRGQGYRVVPPSEQAMFAAEQAMRDIRRAIKKGDQIMTHTRLDALNNDERKRHMDAHIRLTGIGQIMRRQRRELLKLTSTDP